MSATATSSARPVCKAVRVSDDPWPPMPMVARRSLSLAETFCGSWSASKRNSFAAAVFDNPASKTPLAAPILMKSLLDFLLILPPGSVVGPFNAERRLYSLPRKNALVRGQWSGEKRMKNDQPHRSSICRSLFCCHRFKDSDHQPLTPDH